MTIQLHHNDLPTPAGFPDGVAVDTETMGLNTRRDRLCLVQLSGGDGNVDLVKIDRGQTEAPNLVAVLTDPATTKIFHFARFDLAALNHAFGIEVAPVWCTKIASRLVRTYTDRHGLKDLAAELLGQDMSKKQQSSDWGSADLTDAQMQYAASDVLYLHRMKEVLEQRLKRENRLALAEACFEFLPTRAALDLAGWGDTDIFAHS